MEQKQRFFIYDRREMGVLVILGVMVAVFAFTLGVHLGKRVGPKGYVAAPGDAEPVVTLPDQVPNRQELTEQAKGAQQAADESLNQALHDEVARTGIKLDTPRQVELPDHARSKNAGATTLNSHVASTHQAPDAHGADHHSAADSHDASEHKAANSHGTDHKTADAHEAGAHQAADSHARKSPKIERRHLPVDPADIEAAKKGDPEVDAVAAHRPPPAGKFTLQIGSYPLIEEAKDQADSLEALGLRPFLRPAEVKGRRWYRVFVGGFDSKETADQMGKRYVSQHMVEGYVVSKMTD